MKWIKLISQLRGQLTYSWFTQLMMDALGLKDNANNVYKNNVNKWGTFERTGIVGQEKKTYRSCNKETISVPGPPDISIKQHSYVYSMYYITAHK